MTAALLGASWAVAVLVVATRRRPPPARVLALAPHQGRHRQAGPRDPLAVVGAAVLRRIPAAARVVGQLEASPDRAGAGRADVTGSAGAGRADVTGSAGAGRAGCTGTAGARSPTTARPTGDGSPDVARAAGTATLVALCALAVAPAAAPLAALGAVVVIRERAKAAGRRRVRRMEEALPDIVDLLVLAVGAGCNVPLAVAAAGRRGTGPLALELRRVSADVDRGRRVADALDDLPARAGEPARQLAVVLAGCERYGAPVLPALERLADEVRRQRRRRAETAARRVPVTLLFPLTLCILPAFALLTVAPLVAGALRELRL